MKNILNKTLYKSNKEFASIFRDTDAFHYLYNTNLLNIINSMFLIKKGFENVAFMGPNPDIFLSKLPPGKNSYKHTSDRNKKLRLLRPLRKQFNRV